MKKETHWERCQTLNFSGHVSEVSCEHGLHHKRWRVLQVFTVQDLIQYLFSSNWILSCPERQNISTNRMASPDDLHLWAESLHCNAGQTTCPMDRGGGFWIILLLSRITIIILNDIRIIILNDIMLAMLRCPNKFAHAQNKTLLRAKQNRAPWQTNVHQQLCGLAWAVGAAMLLHQLENTANCYCSLLMVLSQAHKTAGYFLHYFALNPLHTVASSALYHLNALPPLACLGWCKAPHSLSQNCQWYVSIYSIICIHVVKPAQLQHFSTVY